MNRVGTKGIKGFETIHGHSVGGKTKVYRAWRSMIGRCYNKNVKRYESYGARGISVCDRWRCSFENFLADMGEPPTNKHSLDRMDTDGNYEPSNCRWSDVYTQANNKRRNVFIDVSGVRMTVSQAERVLGFRSGTIKSRLYAGWPVERAIREPVMYTSIKIETTKKNT